eukprot:CAMPEP_0179013666 /NCGR_PEP_ID=MMETSP0796-20121207/1847_1 /TAXON_ID=73915 /ORGANISM="Pyrodinium bahamense, Strain pbaha01" /LENGTH=105 /DNA_ID=CAMNT_0020709183 /DNA_START=55 /DNA_END=372 /DNA_ORIENTATION=+
MSIISAASMTMAIMTQCGYWNVQRRNTVLKAPGNSRRTKSSNAFSASVSLASFGITRLALIRAAMLLYTSSLSLSMKHTQFCTVKVSSLDRIAVLSRTQRRSTMM